MPLQRFNKDLKLSLFVMTAAVYHKISKKFFEHLKKKVKFEDEVLFKMEMF